MRFAKRYRIDLTSRIVRFSGFIAAAALLVAAEAGATVILSAQSVSSAPLVVGSYSFDNTIDQSGLSAGYVSGVTDFDTYAASMPTHTLVDPPPNYAATNSVAPQNVDFDLGASYAVTALAFWNYPFQDFGSVTALEVYTSELPDFTTSFFAGSFSPLVDAAPGTNAIQDFDLSDSTGRFVRLRVTGHTGSAGFGFSEVAFAVPEPSTGSLLALGLAGIAAARRRRTPHFR